MSEIEKKGDDGQAFPTEGGESSGCYAHPGMSLREYYAGQALIGTCLHSDAHNWSPEGIAERAKRIADAMMKVMPP
jgi:hypothetical protein